MHGAQDSAALSLTHNHGRRSHDRAPFASNPVGNKAQYQLAKDDSANLRVCDGVAELDGAVQVLGPATRVLLLPDSYGRKSK